MVLLALSACSISGCIITTDVQFVGPSGIEDSGSCMCAVCWNRAFCLSSAGTSVALPSETAP